jgi:hypothetical protein
VESHGPPDDPLLICECSPNRDAGNGGRRQQQNVTANVIVVTSNNGSITVARDISWLLWFGLSGLRSGI